MDEWSMIFIWESMVWTNCGVLLYLETIAAKAPDQRCLVMLTAPDPWTWIFSCSETWLDLYLWSTSSLLPFIDRLKDEKTTAPAPCTLRIWKPTFFQEKQETVVELDGMQVMKEAGIVLEWRKRPPGKKNKSELGCWFCLNKRDIVFCFVLVGFGTIWCFSLFSHVLVMVWLINKNEKDKCLFYLIGDSLLPPSPLHCAVRFADGASLVSSFFFILCISFKTLLTN